MRSGPMSSLDGLGSMDGPELARSRAVLNAALNAEYVAKLEAVAHRAWHLMDDSGELPDAHDWQHSRRDHERLSGALDGLEAAGWAAHSDGVELVDAADPERGVLAFLKAQQDVLNDGPGEAT